MNSNTCNLKGHNQRRISFICLNTQCKIQRQCCQLCQNKFHSAHQNQVVQIDDVLNFIKNKSNGQIQLDPYIQQILYNLKKVLTNLKELYNTMEDEIQKIQTMNLKQICEHLRNKYSLQNQNAQPLNNEDLNSLAEDMIQHVQVKDLKIVQKDQTDSLQKIMTNILDKFKSIQTSLDVIKMDKEYKYKGPQQMEGHTDTVYGIDICKQRNLLASGSNDKTVRLWNLEEKAFLKYYAYPGPVYDVVFSKQGDLLAFGGGGDYSIKVFDVLVIYKDNLIANLCGHTNKVYRLVFTNNSNFLISGSGDQTVLVWNLKDKSLVIKFNSGGEVNGVAVRPDDSEIACNSFDGQISIWNLQNQKKLCQQSAHDAGSGIEFSSDQNILVSSGSEGETKLWSLEVLWNQRKLILIREFQAASTWVWTVMFSPCSRYILQICDEDGNGEVKLFDSQTGKALQLFKFTQQKPNYIVALARSKDMDIIAYSENYNILVMIQQ